MKEEIGRSKRWLIFLFTQKNMAFVDILYLTEFQCPIDDGRAPVHDPGVTSLILCMCQCKTLLRKGVPRVVLWVSSKISDDQGGRTGEYRSSPGQSRIPLSSFVLFDGARFVLDSLQYAQKNKKNTQSVA